MTKRVYAVGDEAWPGRADRCACKRDAMTNFQCPNSYCCCCCCCVLRRKPLAKMLLQLLLLCDEAKLLLLLLLPQCRCCCRCRRMESIRRKFKRDYNKTSLGALKLS